MNRGYIYFLTNRNNRSLYVGVTNDIVRRTIEHKAKINSGFTAQYCWDRLVYFERYERITEAISREKQLKKWRREWKNALVEKENPKWEDLSAQIGVKEEFVEIARSRVKRGMTKGRRSG